MGKLPSHESGAQFRRQWQMCDKKDNGRWTNKGSNGCDQWHCCIHVHNAQEGTIRPPQISEPNETSMKMRQFLRRQYVQKTAKGIEPSDWASKHHSYILSTQEQHRIVRLYRRKSTFSAFTVPVVLAGGKWQLHRN